MPLLLRFLQRRIVELLPDVLCCKPSRYFKFYLSLQHGVLGQRRCRMRWSVASLLRLECDMLTFALTPARAADLVLSSGTTTISSATTFSGTCSLSGTAILVVNANMVLSNGCTHTVSELCLLIWSTFSRVAPGVGVCASGLRCFANVERDLQLEWGHNQWFWHSYVCKFAHNFWICRVKCDHGEHSCVTIRVLLKLCRCVCCAGEHSKCCHVEWW